MDRPTPSPTAAPPSPTAAGSQVHHNHGATPHKLLPSPTAAGMDRPTPSATAAPVGARSKDDLWPNSLRPTKSEVHHNHGATPHKLGPSPSAAENYRPTPATTARPAPSSGDDELWANSLRPSTVAQHYRLSATARPETWVDIDA